MAKRNLINCRECLWEFCVLNYGVHSFPCCLTYPADPKQVKIININIQKKLSIHWGVNFEGEKPLAWSLSGWSSGETYFCPTQTQNWIASWSTTTSYIERRNHHNSRWVVYDTSFKKYHASCDRVATKCKSISIAKTFIGLHHQTIIQQNTEWRKIIVVRYS